MTFRPCFSRPPLDMYLGIADSTNIHLDGERFSYMRVITSAVADKFHSVTARRPIDPVGSDKERIRDTSRYYIREHTDSW